MRILKDKERYHDGTTFSPSECFTICFDRFETRKPDPDPGNTQRDDLQADGED